MIAIDGLFYEFHRERVISRAGQPLRTLGGIEIGPEISKEDAFRRVRSGKDVYTLRREDAYRLATQLHAWRTVEEETSPHQPPEPSPTGREDVYYRHFHPGGIHEGFGHIFFGARGENYNPTT